MTKSVRIWTTGFVMALAVAIATSPADAQGNGRGRGQDRATFVDRDFDDLLRGRDLRLRPAGNGAGKVPPGWCRGVGNPHNTPENCGYRFRDERTRYSVYDRYYGRGRSYEQAHIDFHRELDAYYARLAAQRPLDFQYQIELQVRKRAEHEDWHRRMGIPH